MVDGSALGAADAASAVPPPLEGFSEAFHSHHEGENEDKADADAQNSDGTEQTIAGPPPSSLSTSLLPSLLASTLSASVSSPHLRALARQLLLE